MKINMSEIFKWEIILFLPFDSDEYVQIDCYSRSVSTIVIFNVLLVSDIYSNPRYSLHRCWLLLKTRLITFPIVHSIIKKKPILILIELILRGILIYSTSSDHWLGMIARNWTSDSLPVVWINYCMWKNFPYKFCVCWLIVLIVFLDCIFSVTCLFLSLK